MLSSVTKRDGKFLKSILDVSLTHVRHENTFINVPITLSSNNNCYSYIILSLPSLLLKRPDRLFMGDGMLKNKTLLLMTFTSSQGLF